MKVKNYMEEVVNMLFPLVIQQFPNQCTCERCVADIKALALNGLPPKYVATPLGEVYSKTSELSVQFEVDVFKELILAIKKVGQWPRH